MKGTAFRVTRPHLAASFDALPHHNATFERAEGYSTSVDMP